MATPTATTEEPAEAIIISGPRKGEFIRVGNTDYEPALSPEADALLDQAVLAARSMAETARSARMEMEALLQEMREARRRRHESAGQNR
jgi:hypothetical protein